MADTIRESDSEASFRWPNNGRRELESPYAVCRANSVVSNHCGGRALGGCADTG